LCPSAAPSRHARTPSARNVSVTSRAHITPTRFLSTMTPSSPSYAPCIARSASTQSSRLSLIAPTLTPSTSAVVDSSRTNPNSIANTFLQAYSALLARYKVATESLDAARERIEALETAQAAQDPEENRNINVKKQKRRKRSSSVPKRAVSPISSRLRPRVPKK